MKLSEYILDNINQNILYGKVHYKNVLNEMPNINKSKTGLQMNIWLESKRDTQHNLPRLKFCRKTDNIAGNSVKDYIPISISDEPVILTKKHLPIEINNKAFDELCLWIIINKVNLLKFWNKEIDSVTLLLSIKKIN